MQHQAMCAKSKNEYAFIDFIENYYRKKVSEVVYKALVRYCDIYYYHNIMWLSASPFGDKIDIRKNMLKEAVEWITPQVMITEASFFTHTDFFLPSLVFTPTRHSMKMREYMELRLGAFFNPNESKVHIIDKQDIESMVNKELEAYGEMAQPLYPLAMPSRAKETGDKGKMEEILEQIQKQYNTESDPYFYFIQARFFAHQAIGLDKKQQKDFLQKAQECYLSALEYGRGVMGANFKSVIHEGMAVAAQLTREYELNLNNAKAPFCKFYKEAYFAGITTRLPNELPFLPRDYKHYFEITFINPFEQQDKGGISILESKKKLKKAKRDKDFFRISPNFSVCSGKREIDYKNPNKWIKDVGPNPITQLMYACMMNDIGSVRKLIECGADVNMLKKSDNASALHYAMPGIEIFGADKQASIEKARLLIPLMEKKTLDSRLVKKRETALSKAIELGLVEIVELLVQHGADIKSPTTLGNHSPLYWCLICLAHAKGGSKGFIPNTLTEQNIKDIMLANGASPLNESANIQQYMDMQQNEISRIFRSFYFNSYKVNLKQYRQICHILINALDDVDIVEKEVHNFTPLILATELDEVEIIKKLLAKGADKYHKTTDGATAYNYAATNCNIELMNLLK